MSPESRARILVVDDSPEKLVALSAVLDGLADELVTARSGREALRLLLGRDFALILLDVRMPGLDGFETAQLIRQRKSSEHTPIIFVTAYAEDEVSSTGYALGAVDFIAAPVRPEVLRSKAAVFLDLFRQQRQIREQTEALRRRAEQLQHLTRASLSIHGARSLEEMLDVATHFSRELVGADEAVTLASLEANGTRILSASSFPDGSAAERRRAVEEASVFTALLGDACHAFRVTAEALASEARWETFRAGVSPSRQGLGRLATALKSRDGRHLGWLCAASDASRPFGAEDELLLTQLAQVTTIALENALFAEAREAHRLKDQFLSTLSHELRTPLTAILGWVRLLRSSPPAADQLAHGLDVIERNVTAQVRMIDDLLDVSRIAAGKLVLDPGELRPVALLESTVEAMLPVAAAKGVSLGLEVDPSLSRDAVMAGDPDRLQQVVWNLLTNALKFTSSGGRVALTLGAAGGRLCLRVADDGAGISPAFLGSVFDRFRQADTSTTRSQGGLGIGLALVRHIVELHGGSVTAESPGLGKGATFTVLLPFSPPPRRSAREDDAAAGDRRGLAGLRALVVDDEPDAREVLREILVRAGMSVEAVPSADAAVESLDARRFDVLISDIGMPGADGISLVRRVRASPHAAIAAIAVTAYAREEERVLALAAGFDRHLAKPIEPASLVAAVRELAAGARPAGAAREDACRVLVVEDDGDSREGLRRFLELCGHTVDVAGTGVDGIEKALRDRPDVAFVDISLPDVDGHEVARRIREWLSKEEIQLVALTGYRGLAARREALEAGFDVHVGKPVDLAGLEALLRPAGRRGS